MSSSAEIANLFSSGTLQSMENDLKMLKDEHKNAMDAFHTLVHQLHLKFHIIKTEKEHSAVESEENYKIFNSYIRKVGFYIQNECKVENDNPRYAIILRGNNLIRDRNNEKYWYNSDQDILDKCETCLTGDYFQWLQSLRNQRQQSLAIEFHKMLNSTKEKTVVGSFFKCCS